MDRSRPSLLLGLAKQQSDTMGLGSKLRLVQTDVHQLPFSNSSVDRITCHFGIMFFADIDTAFIEMLRVLKSDESLFWRGVGSSNPSSRVPLG
jgi:ubiquinone/menaquinone biosynthesis C-methylase UbiE